jgi:hypothetical protein
MAKTMKEDLRFLVEEFLEKSGPEIIAKIVGDSEAAKAMWEHLEGILFADIFWMDEVGSEDKNKSDYEKLLTDYHAFLKPIWSQFKDALFDYKYNIIPNREQLRRSRKNIDKDKASAFSVYRSLLKGDTVLDWEKFYDITLTVSFDPDHVAFYKRSMNVIKNFMDLLSGVDINDFKRCDHCGKCIVLKRSDKRFCPGCAAKKFQKDKWASDPETMKEKEKLRYHKTRKKI